MLSARSQAALVLSKVINKHQSLNEILPQATLNHADKPFMQELCFGVMRWFWQLDFIIKKLLTKPLKSADMDIQSLLLIGVYQLLHLNTPPHAALHATVQAARELKKPWATKLINGVLRNFLREQPVILDAMKNDKTAYYSHPQWLIKKLQQDYPQDWQALLSANNNRPPMVLRVNLLKISREVYLELLNSKEIAAETVNFSAAAIQLKQPCDVKELPGFTEGMISVQDAAAQLAADVLKLEPKIKVLDACAAPGGKSAHILESQPKINELVSIDLDPQRVKKIEENLLRLGFLPAEKIKVISADLLDTKAWWKGELFDRILLDAPCSATGVIRRHPDIKYLRRASDISDLANKQLKFLKTIWPLLKKQGLLVYATCSVLAEENTNVIEKFISSQNDAAELPIQAEWGRAQKYGHQILTGENDMDGFYYACLLKK